MAIPDGGLITETNQQYYAGAQGFLVSAPGGQSTFTFTFDITNSGVADDGIVFSTVMTDGQANVVIPSTTIGDGSDTPVTKTITADTVLFSDDNFLWIQKELKKSAI